MSKNKNPLPKVDTEAEAEVKTVETVAPVEEAPVEEAPAKEKVEDTPIAPGSSIMRSDA